MHIIIWIYLHQFTSYAVLSHSSWARQCFKVMKDNSRGAWYGGLEMGAMPSKRGCSFFIKIDRCSMMIEHLLIYLELKLHFGGWFEGKGVGWYKVAPKGCKAYWGVMSITQSAPSNVSPMLLSALIISLYLNPHYQSIQLIGQEQGLPILWSGHVKLFFLIHCTVQIPGITGHPTV